MLKDLVWIFLVFSLSSLFCATYGQYLELPQVPCPNYFQYLNTGNSYIGQLILPNVQSSSTQVDLQFSQRVPVQSNYYGSLSLYQDQQTTIRNIERGQPVLYRVDFPLSNVVPKLTQIAINGLVICSASEYPPPSTQLKLQHTLRTSITNSGGRHYTPNRFYNYDYYSNDVYQNQYNPIFSNTLSSRPQISVPNVYYNQPVAFEAPERTVPRQSRPRPQQPRTQPQPEPSQPQPPRPQPSFVTRTTAQPQVSQRPQPVEQRATVVCGQEGTSNNFTPYILGGRPLRRGEYPWLTAIYRKYTAGSNFICGGSLISSSLVLSAAHCFDGQTSDKISVTLGRYNLSNSMEDVQSRDIQSLIIHPEYKPGGTRFPDADLALLQMYQVVSFTTFISPICLWTEASEESLIEGQSAMVAGWGLDESNNLSPVPKKVEADIVSDRKCLNSSPGFFGITSERTICAGKRDGTGPCIGDSGGGLMMFRNDRWVLRGVVSAGQTERMRCNLLEYVVFCDVAKHISYTQYIRPICLWSEASDQSLVVGQTAMVAGWGKDEYSEISTIPKKVSANVVSETQCLRSSVAYNDFTSSRTLCAGNRDNTGPCVGDSGSGLMLNRGGRWTLRGVVSAGQTEQQHCKLLEYVVYCDVAKHISWILSYMRQG